MSNGYTSSIDVIFIKVPSFESRTKDLKDISVCKIREIEGSLGLDNVTLSKEATPLVTTRSSSPSPLTPSENTALTLKALLTLVDGVAITTDGGVVSTGS